MRGRVALLTILALLLVLTSVASANELPPPEPGCFRIIGTSKWVKPWPPEPDDDGYAEFRAKAEGTVSGIPLFDGGRFTFMEVGGGNENTYLGWTDGVLTVKPGPPGGKVVIEFQGDTYFGFDDVTNSWGVIVEGSWVTVKANGHYRDFAGTGDFKGIADLCYPDYDKCPFYPGFYVDFCPPPPPPHPADAS